MSCATTMRAALVMLVLTVTTAGAADAQIFKRARDAASRAAEREVVRKVDREVTNAVTCALGDRACAERAREEGKDVQIVDGDGQPVVSAFVNFDFVPGERVLSSHDFASDVVGDFPRRLEFVRGNMEVAEWNGARWLRGTSSPSSFLIPLPETLPERFTLEMDVVPGQENWPVRIFFAEKPRHHVEARYFQRGLAGRVAEGSNPLVEGRTEEQVSPGTPFPLRVMADGRYVKVYVAGTRVANVPNAELGRSGAIRVELSGGADVAGYVRNIRVAAGGRTLYDALEADGRVATQGIYFDTNSDVIRPESAPTLEQIAKLLDDHGDLRLTIEGHTDSSGDAAANQQLSQRRAEAVKRALVEEHGVAGDRLEARGMGASVPAADNATPEGRQQNRRVELVRS